MGIKLIQNEFHSGVIADLGDPTAVMLEITDALLLLGIIH